MPALDEVDFPRRWRTCPECREKKPGVRRDLPTKLTQCDPCWFKTDPARHGHPGEKRS